MKATKRAFTLIELLVVISIIALLMGILMPALSKVRKRGKTIACSSNIRQLNTALRLYTEDNGDKIPKVTYAAGEYWFHQIAKYLGSPKDSNSGVKMPVAVCPEATIVNEKATAAVPYGKRDRSYLWSWGKFFGSYGMNMWLAPDGDFSPFTANNIYAIGPPENYYMQYYQAKGNVPVFFDSIWVGAWPKDTDLPPKTLDGDATPIGMARLYIDRHSMAVNIAFADGSVNRIVLKELWQEKWNPKFRCGPMPTVRRR